MATDGKSEQIILQFYCRAAEDRRTPKRWRAGWARHSVRAAVVNPNAPVGRRRRAGDCAPYPRFPASARFSGIGKPHFMCQPVSIPDFRFFMQVNSSRPVELELSYARIISDIAQRLVRVI